MDRPPRRIVVIGRAGAGKSTIAVRLGEALELPVVHLDRLYWNADWTPVDESVFSARQAAAVAGDRWVIDGGYTATAGYAERVGAADLIVVAEAPLIVCLWRVVRRRLIHRRGGRPDGPAGAREKIDLAFLRWIVTFGRRHPDLAAEVRAIAPAAAIVVVRDRGEALLRRIAP